jgi:hypothetical protein
MHAWAGGNPAATVLRAAAAVVSLREILTRPAEVSGELPVLAGIVAAHGYGGLALATMMAVGYGSNGQALGRTRFRTGTLRILRPCGGERVLLDRSQSIRFD